MKLIPYEIWRDIVGYEGLYQVSCFGNVKSIARTVIEKSGKVKHLKERILKPGPLRGGYLGVALHKDFSQKTKKIHRLVAEAFIQNPLNLPYVNHKDENPKNNTIFNLEWCDATYNINYGTSKHRMSKIKEVPVYQYSLAGEFITKWDSIKQAQDALHISHISEACRGIYKQSNGYIWRYEKEQD